MGLGGGFKYFLFSSLPGEMIQFDKYFSNGLKPPTWGDSIQFCYFRWLFHDLPTMRDSSFAVQGGPQSHDGYKWREGHGTGP